MAQNSQVVLNKLVDVRVDSSQSLSVTHDALMGGANVVRQGFKPTVATTSNMDFVIQTPGLGQFVSRRIDIVGELPFEFTVYNNGTGSETQYLIAGSDVGLEAFPMNSLITSATVQISTSSFTTQQQAIMPLLKRLLRKSEKQEKMVAPSSLGQTSIIYPRNVTPYIQGVLAGTQGRQEDSYGNASQTGRIEFRSINVNGTGGFVAPSGLITVPVATAGPPIVPSFVIVRGVIKINEPLLCQPFKMDDEVVAFINTNLITVRLNLSDLGAVLARVLRFPIAANASSGRPGKQYTGLKFDTSNPAALENFKLVCTFISPPASARVPASTIYDTVNYNPVPTTLTLPAALPYLAEVEVQSTTITLNTAPDLIAIYFVPTLLANSSDGRPVTAMYGAGSVFPGTGLSLEDSLVRITKLNMSWNNNPSLFATFDAEELYRRTTDNGLVYPFMEGELNCATAAVTAGGVDGLNSYFPWTVEAFRNSYRTPGIGYPLLLALNKDIPVEPNVAAGTAGVYTVKVSVTLQNTTHIGSSLTGGTLFVVPITSTYLKLNSGAMSDIIQTVSTEQDVANTPVVGDAQSRQLVSRNMSADPHAVASSRQGFGRILGAGDRRNDTSSASGPAKYLGNKRAYMDM